MFVIDLEYTSSLDRIDELLAAHQAHLRAGHEAGMFLAWGRKEPRTGGIIIAVGERDKVEAHAMSDPFVTEGVAEATISEMIPTFAAEGLESLKQ